MGRRKKIAVDGDDKFEALGIPREWVEVIRKAGYQTVESLKAVENPNKLHQQLCGINKKEKLGLAAPAPEQVKQWIG